MIHSSTPRIEDIVNINNLVLSCEANDLNQNIGTNVSLWRGRVNSFITNAPNQTPTLELDSLGFKCLRFNGINQSLISTLSTIQQPSITIVMSIDLPIIPVSAVLFKNTNNPDREPVPYLNNNSIDMAITDYIVNSGRIISPPIRRSVKGVFSYIRDSSGLCSFFWNTKLIHQQTISNLNYSSFSSNYVLFKNGSASAFFQGSIYHIHIIHDAIPLYSLLNLIKYTGFKSGVNI